MTFADMVRPSYAISDERSTSWTQVAGDDAELGTTRLADWLARR